MSDIPDFDYNFKKISIMNFMCPITHSLMVDPVILIDGHTYERKAIERWLTNHETSPKTNLPLVNKILIPNISIKVMIDEMVSSGELDEKLYNEYISRKVEVDTQPQRPSSPKKEEGETSDSDDSSDSDDLSELEQWPVLEVSYEEILRHRRSFLHPDLHDQLEYNSPDNRI
tara:strand:- start:79 stop:594 length:516 start_codon:yes stop_codon:yes gene_type:complete